MSAKSRMTVRSSTFVPLEGQGAVVLRDGRVLVVGGDGGRGFPDTDPTVRATAMQFGPGTGTWSVTGALPDARERFAIAVLSNGNVLVAGGSAQPYPGHPSAAAYLYDAKTGAWRRTGGMHQAREERSDIGIDLHAVPLAGGKVLVLGGVAGALPGAASTEVFDPATQRWSPAANIPCHHARSFEVTAAMLLPAGKVLALCDGYRNILYPEEYDPITGVWRALHARREARYRYSATLLRDGTVLVAGGSSDPYGNHPITSAEVYDPTTDSWSEAGHLRARRIGQSAIRLAGGDVLVMGGYALVKTGPSVVSTEAVNTSELYHPGTRTWTVTGSTQNSPRNGSLVLLHDARVLNVDGSASELYDARNGAWTSVPGAAVPG